jgi:hypothetical protein
MDGVVPDIMHGAGQPSCLARDHATRRSILLRHPGKGRNLRVSDSVWN